MRKFSKVFFVGLISVTMFLTGAHEVNGSPYKIEQVINPLTSITTVKDNKDLIPLKEAVEDKKLVGIGEATHGNKEFFQVKERIFMYLVEEAGIKNIAIEADFGGARKVNDYITTGEGTAKDAVYSLGFGMFKVQEMIDMVEAMRHYNEKVPVTEQIHVYGFDMQRYDKNKEYFLNYIEKVNSKKAQVYTRILTPINDATGYTQSKSVLKEGTKNIKQMIQEVESNKASYIQKTSIADYEKALRHAKVIEQNIDLRMNNHNYSNIRDKYMAQNVTWILEHEKLLGREGLVLSGHNGHIERVSSSMYYGMGNHLADQYGENYYAIGTEFFSGEVRARNGEAGERIVHKVATKDKEDFAYIMMEKGIEKAFIDFNSIDENHSSQAIFGEKRYLNSYGDAISSMQKLLKRGHMVEQVPNKSYDGLIFIKEVTPTTLVE